MSTALWRIATPVEAGAIHPIPHLTSSCAPPRRSAHRSLPLNADHLRAWLTGLPDFEDIAAEEEALEHAQSFESFTTALHFLMTWPAFAQAAALITNRAAEIDGNHYELLGPASEVLEDKYPLAATLLKRGLIDFALKNGRVKRYPHAARHLRECKNLAARIDDFAPFETHEAYVAGLRAAHGKKTSFWGPGM
jgi:Family of unknown function (DUF6880)